MKSIFISGGANGIGLATAQFFLAKGWRVGVGDLVAPQALPGAAFFTLDVRDRTQWDAALAEFAGSEGLDVLVNNAGVVRYGAFQDVAADGNDLIVDVNLKGNINGARTGLPYLQKRRGMLINVSSAGALYGGANLAVYSATKFGVRGLSEALDQEWAPLGVKVRCIMPWYTETRFLSQPGEGGRGTIGKEMAERSGVHTADRVAQEIWKALHSEQLHYPVGGKAKMLRILAGLAPGIIRKARPK